MYFVDRETIHATLSYMEEQIAFFEAQTSWSTRLSELALERCTHVIIESIIDVGNSMIDGFIMRDPGSYEDIIEILEDEKVITPDMKPPLVKVIQLRKLLVQEFTTLSHSHLEETLRNHLSELQAFAPAVRDYLTNELGPVSAFRN
ncbi:DUF86 domain-containing protein [Jeotgalibacillus aurantiacus]|uniref:DUF86 domain-containing protein n=1 Tax=Jeotgalibacillus aurantiacus TaxID=2763266 RepID=UPI001D0AD73F|nr:DUF86 domain-containing protein [Jeotgalibacillus aurantiacus]